MKTTLENTLKEDRIINGGFLTIALAIVISGINTKLLGLQLFPVSMCAVAIPSLAFNAFIIEYKKRFKIDINHWGYNLLVVAGITFTILGLVSALAIKSKWLFSAFIFGLVLTAPSFIYLGKLVNSNKTSKNEVIQNRKKT